MYRLLLFWAPHLARGGPKPALGFAFAAISCYALELPVVIICFAGFLAAPALFYRWWAQLIRFVWQTRHFRKLAREAVTLYYSPGFQTDPDLTPYLQRCERGLADFA